jgi:hypothetical protein
VIKYETLGKQARVTPVGSKAGDIPENTDYFTKARNYPFFTP